MDRRLRVLCLQRGGYRLQAKYPQTSIHCDLSELRGYSYHTGLVFAAFMPGQGREIARGGRYDDIGEVFGNARPATGFSTDLLNLYQLGAGTGEQPAGILAPDSDDPELVEKIRQLRDQGEKVLVDLSEGRNSPAEQNCDRHLTQQDGIWAVDKI